MYNTTLTDTGGIQDKPVSLGSVCSPKSLTESVHCTLPVCMGQWRDSPVVQVTMMNTTTTV